MSTTPPVLGRPVAAKGEETRQRVLAATMRCVAEMGYSRATIREIARVAQMTSGSLYHYFPNKSELVKAAFLELSGISLPRLAAAADRADGVLDKLMAVLDEGDRILRDHPFAVAFDRAIRVESAADLHLAEESDTIFTSLRDVVTGIMEQAQREGALGPEADVESASNAIHTIMLGLSEHTATTPPEVYQATGRALRLLIQGSLFDYTKLA